MTNSEQSSITDNDWYALRVRARGESTVAASLERRGFECFAPGWETRSGARGRLIMTAAFPGYIFSRFSLKDLFRVLNTPGVQQVMGYGSPTSVDHETITALQTAFASRIRVLPSVYIQDGDAVEVVRGPMKGATGILVRTKDQFRLVIQIHILQRSVYTEVDADAVVPRHASSVAA